MREATRPISHACQSDTRVIALVSAAHFVSHYYILLLPPLFLFIRAEYGVSFTQLGLALTAFNVTSAAFQTPAGFLVDRVGARIVLVGGLLIGACTMAVAGLVPSFWVLVVMFGLSGIGNAVYHPADYALLSHFVSEERIGQAYSIHSVAGFLGTAVAPMTLLWLESVVGWRGALMAASVLGLAVAGLLISQSAALVEVAHSKKGGPAVAQKDVGWRLLLSPAILLNLVFFVFYAIINAGFQNYAVVALGALFAIPLSVANGALTAYLLLSVVGVLAGGIAAGRVARHGLIIIACVVPISGVAVLIGTMPLGALLLFPAMAAAGFCFGVLTPSRDMIIRAATPEGSFGKVFGFVTTGFNVGGMLSPILFGWFLDVGAPQAILYVTAAAALLAILTVAPSLRRRVSRDAFAHE